MGLRIHHCNITYLSESLYDSSALSTLFGRYMRYIRLRYYYNYIITSIQPIGNLLTKHCNYIDRFKMSIHAGNYTVQCGLIVSMYRGSLINWITYDTWQVSGVVCLVLFQHVHGYVYTVYEHVHGCNG